MLDPNGIPVEDDGSPRVVSLWRDGKEVTARSAGDGLEATFELFIMLAERREALQIGDQIVVTRV